MRRLKAKIELYAAIITIVAGAVTTYAFFFKDSNYSIFELMVIERIKNPPPKTDVLIPNASNNYIVHNYTDKGNLDANGCLLFNKQQEVLKLAQEVSDRSKQSLLLKRLLNHSLCLEEIDFSINFVQDIRDRDIRDSSYQAIIKYLLSKNDSTRAAMVSNKIRDRYLRDATKQKIIGFIEN